MPKIPETLALMPSEKPTAMEYKQDKSKKMVIASGRKQLRKRAGEPILASDLPLLYRFPSNP